MYRQRGSAACAAPALRSEELTAVMAEIFRTELVDKQGLADCLMKILRAAARDPDSPRPRRVEEERARLEAKKERLLELSVAGALDISEFKMRNDALNRQLLELESRRADPGPGLDETRIREELGRVLDPAGEMNAVLAAAILERVTVQAESNPSELVLDVLLKTGRRYAAVFRREKGSFRITCLKSIIPNPPIRRT